MDLGRATSLTSDESPSPVSLANRVRTALEDEIAAGVLPPGARLDEILLARRFGVSRTPIREALKQLDAVGMVARGPRRTQLVAEIPPPALDRMFEFMGEMEALCVRLAVLNMSPRERTVLEHCQEDCRRHVRLGDHSGYAEADAAFHAAIYSGTHNVLAIESTQQIWQRIAPFRRHQLLTGERLVDSQIEHESILTAILQGNVELAAGAIRRHIAAVRDSFSEATARKSLAGRG